MGSPFGSSLSSSNRIVLQAAIGSPFSERTRLAQAHNALGVNSLHQGRPQDALVHFEEGLQCKPDDVEIHLNRSLTWLLLGDYEAGWVEYEWRWKMKNAMICPYPQPAWDGAALPGGTIVLWAEQGLGDSLQFVRYAALVKERVGKVLVDCPAPLRGLVVSCPGVDGLAGGGIPAVADVQAPLMSLPRILGSTVATIPASNSYLFGDGALRESWRAKMETGKGLKVGLCWQGNVKHSGDQHRSIALTRFRPLLQVPGVQWFSLQKGAGSEQLAALAKEFGIIDLGSLISADFRDTAAAMANLDLVISVDTSVAHLAGALGIPVWVLLPFNPDWRWLLGREDSPWYPSVRLFRQSRWGVWEDVFERLAQALRERARRRLPERVPIQVSIPELLEKTLLEEIQRGRAEENWAALRNAGFPDTDEVAQLVGRLKAAHQALKRIDQEMQAAEPTLALGEQAAELVRNYVQARQEQSRSLAQFRAWLTGENPALGPAA